MGLDSSQEGSLERVIIEVILLKMGYADASLLVPFLKIMRAALDSEVMVAFVYPDKVVMGAVGPGGDELDFPIILIMSACLK